MLKIISASDRRKVDMNGLTPPSPSPNPSQYLDSIFVLLCLQSNGAVTHVLTCLKNNVVVTGASKSLVASALGWNQSLITAMYFHIIIIISTRYILGNIDFSFVFEIIVRKSQLDLHFPF